MSSARIRGQSGAFAILFLGMDLLDRIWATSDLGEADALALAVEAQHATRDART